MLDLLDAIILTLTAADGKISGRTAIQKLFYFEADAGLVNVKYRPYYYGPYSAELAGTIETAVALKFIEENTSILQVSDPIERKRYEYSLTKDGVELSKQLVKEYKQQFATINRIVRTSKQISNLDVNTLSYAAKIHYIITTRKKSMTFDEITEAANSYGWQLSKPQIAEAKELLDALYSRR